MKNGIKPRPYQLYHTGQLAINQYIIALFLEKIFLTVFFFMVFNELPDTFF